MAFDITQNKQIIFGENAVNRLSDIVKKITSKTVLIISYNENAQAVQLIFHQLHRAGISFISDDSLRGEPTTDDVNRIGAAAKTSNCGAVISIGGGSVMDTGKAVAMLITNGGTVEQYQMGEKAITKDALPLIAIPTTAGTGSEATRVSVVYNTQNHLKKSFYSQSMIAHTVLLDPSLTLELPRDVTVSTGIDALSHAIESYVSLDATPYTEMFSLQSMRLVKENLENCVLQPDNVRSRGGMLLAAYFGGCALNAGIGLAHIIAQPLGGLLKIPHGVACAIYLPYAMNFNVDYCTKKYCDVARVFGAKGNDGPELAREGIEMVSNYLISLNAPNSIASYLKEDFDLDSATNSVVSATGHIKCNPRPVTRDVIRNVIAQSIR